MLAAGLQGGTFKGIHGSSVLFSAPPSVGGEWAPGLAPTPETEPGAAPERSESLGPVTEGPDDDSRLDLSGPAAG